MDSLRERVARAIYSATYAKPGANYPTEPEEQADAAIATFEVVMLSDEVVVAAGDVIAGEFYADLPMMTGEAYSQVAKTALQAALAAAKGNERSEG